MPGAMLGFFFKPTHSTEYPHAGFRYRWGGIGLPQKHHVRFQTHWR